MCWFYYSILLSIMSTRASNSLSSTGSQALSSKNPINSLASMTFGSPKQGGRLRDLI